MEVECASESPVKPMVQTSVASATESDLELQSRLLRVLHGSEPYHWAGSAE